MRWKNDACTPRIEEVTYDPTGEEIKRGDAEEVFANVNEELPLVWTKHRIDRREACRKFAFCRTLQITHRDGLLLIIFRYGKGTG